MRKKGSYIVLILLLCIGTAGAQDIEVSDTVIVSKRNKSLQSNSIFSPVNPTQVIEEKKVPDEKVQALKKDDAYWYANLEPKKEKEAATKPESKSIFDKNWFGNFLWILIIISFVAVVIWYLASSNVQLFRKAPKRILEEEQSDIAEDIFIIDYDKEISKATQERNYRFAVRLWYLRTLKELSDRNIISYGPEKTNSEYLDSLIGKSYYQDFFRLTRNFEYTWYGQFPLTGEGYSLMQKEFIGFKNSLA